MKPGSTLTTLIEDLKQKPPCGLRDNIIDLARKGFYHDYLTPHATPKMNLVSDLREAGFEDLVAKAMEGGYEGESPKDKLAPADAPMPRTPTGLLERLIDWFDRIGDDDVNDIDWGPLQAMVKKARSVLNDPVVGHGPEPPASESRSIEALLALQDVSDLTRHEKRNLINYYDAALARYNEAAAELDRRAEALARFGHDPRRALTSRAYFIQYVPALAKAMAWQYLEDTNNVVISRERMRAIERHL